MGDWVKIPGVGWTRPELVAHCQFCLPTEDAEKWSVKPGYIYEGDTCVQGNALSSFSNSKPDFFPASIPAPMAYYYLAEGSGYDLTDSVSGNTSAGSVNYVEEHQLAPKDQWANASSPKTAAHSGPNWQEDEYFGTSIACGKIDDTITQKDTLSFADVDYGSSGSWAWSVWFRHEAGVNYPDYQREQFFGHGDPVFPTTSFDQVRASHSPPPITSHTPPTSHHPHLPHPTASSHPALSASPSSHPLPSPPTRCTSSLRSLAPSAQSCTTGKT